MPELPEVETIRRTITDRAKGQTIIDLSIALPRLVKWPTAEEFAAIVRGRQIRQVARRGKYLLFYLDDGYVLVIHLRMTGRLFYVSGSTELDQFVRIIFNLDNGDRLIYADTRTLGTLYVLQESELWRIAGLTSLGPEPLTADFTPDYLKQALKKRSGKIKAVLLDQKVIGGLGNIYVDESLALAGIHPERTAASLEKAEVEKLFAAINQVIEDGILHGGTSFRDYRDGTGGKGSHQHHLHVYGRKSQPCKKCGTLIERIEVGGRGTHYCPVCQK